MTYSAIILADSIARNVRLTTMEVTFPRFILAEFNTHRMLSRNSASSRAVPVERRIEQVRSSPFVPEAFGKNKAGMQSEIAISGAEQLKARAAWLQAAEAACEFAQRLAALGVHKQHANRLLEPFCWHTVVVTATEWANFFALRCHPAAQPEMQIVAKMMRAAMATTTPQELNVGQWHLPYAKDAASVKIARDRGGDQHPQDTIDNLVKISVARCAAVSYERQNVEKSIEAYAKRHDDLLESGHLSPFEHQAYVMTDLEIEMYTPISDKCFVGNFRSPWLQYRKTLPGENVFGGV